MNKEIERLSMYDATIKAWLNMRHYTDITYKELLENMVISLVKEKKIYFDKVVELEMRKPPENIVLRPEGSVIEC